MIDLRRSGNILYLCCAKLFKIIFYEFKCLEYILSSEYLALSYGRFIPFSVVIYGLLGRF